ncbi:MAG: DMT family transporter [Firmicutes bacterium]|nr:DMT family transporter [Bacillota bacterium]
MFVIAVLCIVVSGLLHAIWNLFTKKSDNPAVFLWALQWVAIIFYLPWALFALANHPVPFQGWLFLMGGVAAHGGYVLLLSRIYVVGDLSQVYPMMRGVSPLLVPLMGTLFLGERLPLIGWIGVIGIVSGIILIGPLPFGQGNYRRRRLAWQVAGPAFSVGLAITTYTLLDKITLHYVPPVTLNDASNAGNFLALSLVVMRSSGIKSEWHAHWKTIILGGIISPGSYLLFLVALQMAPVAQVAPMREIGTVFGTILGITVLKETQGTRRIVAAGLITGGMILLGILG